MNKTVGLPVREFFYTTDQVAYLLEIEEDYLKRSLIFYEGRSVGVPPKSQMRAVNFARAGTSPVWRIPESSFKRFLRFKGLKVYNRGYVQ